MKICLCTLFVLMAGVADAAAQAQSFIELQSTLKPGQTVTVLDAKGNKTEGRVGSLTATQLEIVQGEGEAAPRSHLFTESSVRRIRKHDSTWNGMFIGLAAGTLLGVLSCTGDDAEGCPNEGVAVAVVGGVIGYYIDDLIHPTLYLAKTQVAVSIAPLLGPRRMGVAVALRF